ncbi:hypothetical protein J4E91_005278 [Alternaria rosae]|nr:hypothetical protein J4E91_005278 [Alternaria rosae]
MAHKRTPSDRTINARVSKTHITRARVHLNSEPHPAVRTAVKRDKTPRRIDILPLPLTYARLMQIPFDVRFPRQKLIWCSIVYGFVELKREKLGDAGYDEMDCEYDTMDPLAAFEVSGGVFGSPPASVASSPSSSSSSSATVNSFGSLNGSRWSASTFSASAPASSMGSQPSAVAFNGIAGGSSADDSGLSSPEVDMIDSPEGSLPQPVTPAPIAKVNSPPFSSIWYLPSQPLPNEKAVAVESAPVVPFQISGLGYLPSKPLPSEQTPTPHSTPASQLKAAMIPSPESEKTRLGDITEAKFTPPILSPPNTLSSTPTIPPRAKLPSKSCSTTSSLPPEDAPKSDVEIGMGAFSPSKINSSATLVSVFCNSHFKDFFAEEIKALQTCLEKQKEIRGSHLVYLNRSLKWVIDAAEANWFNPDIDFESDDVANWRGKLNVFKEVLGSVVGEDGDGNSNGIAKDTKERIEKVFGLFADEEGVNQGFGFGEGGEP